METNDKKLDRIEERLTVQGETLIRQQGTLEQLTRSVEEHVKRSNSFESALKPIQQHVQMVELGLKCMGAFLATVPSLVFLLRFLGVLK